ncbi:hypothetical protein HAZT_HAZT005733 [Hyalella azteca]|uniref:Fucosyltransferase n=1 Tax=Hyalella azteca TaxID=294128 RepID=A0A6A0HA57_HYAAZ|nr:hypothetical protein HAZT_HAZT005733 [Hyalella azteca]
MGSNCGDPNNRYKYVAELQKYLAVDVYGECGPLKCPGHYWTNCDKLDDYKFYLAFESSNCDEYLTEKVWWNALHKSAVPVVMGPPRYLLNHPAEYQKYHDWRRRYRVLNEHGYSAAPVCHLCRLCEALNYNNKMDQQADLEPFYDRDQQCYPPQWVD